MNRKLIVLIGAFLILSMASGAMAEKLTIVAGDWAPFEFETQGQVVGIDVDIVDSIMKKLGLEYEIKILQWTDAWGMIESGEADAVLSTSRKAKREPFLWYPQENMWVSEYVFFGRADKMGQADGTYAGATGKKVGAVKGYTYNQAYWDAKFDRVDAKSQDESFAMLDRGEVDLVICDRTIGLYTMVLYPTKNKIVPYDEVLFSKGYPMPFAKKSDYPNIQQVAKDFERELKAMKASGQYDQILLKWLKR